MNKLRIILCFSLLFPMLGFAQQEKKHLTVISVFNSWLDYKENSWERYNIVKENDTVQILEICIWNIDEPRISLYKFDKTFNPRLAYGGDAWVKHRESFNVLDVEISEMTSSNVLWAFKEIIKKAVAIAPAKHYGLLYRGHGLTSGGLFEYKLDKPDSETFLDYFCKEIGKKIDFLDWSTTCQAGSYENVKSQYQYADYILASDLDRGGFAADGTAADGSDVKHYPTIIEKFFSPTKSIRQSLVDMIGYVMPFWECPTSKNAMIQGSVRQSISIYDCSKFYTLDKYVNLGNTEYVGDVLRYIRQNYSYRVNLFDDFRFYYISNKDFFNWSVEANGFYKNRPSSPAADSRPVILTRSFDNGVVGQDYSEFLSALGSAPSSWSVVSGKLPAGLNLNSSTGEISGNPSSPGTYPFTVKATNNAGSDTKSLSVVISSKNPASLDNLSKNDPKVFISDNNLCVNSVNSERIFIYSPTGSMLLSKEKPAGTMQIPLKNIRTNILIVKGSSGWSEKVVNIHGK